MGNNSLMKVNDDDYLEYAEKLRLIGEATEECMTQYVRAVEACINGLPEQTAIQLYLFVRSFQGTCLKTMDPQLPQQAYNMEAYLSEIEEADTTLYK